MKHLLVYMTASSQKEAETIADALLTKKLIACANIFPEVTSFYTWKGKRVKEKEVVMTAKTTSTHQKKIVAEVKRVHSYEVPCVVFFEIKGGNSDYIQWLTEATK